MRALGVEGAKAKMADKKTTLLFFVDVDKGRLICLEPVDEKDLGKFPDMCRRSSGKLEPSDYARMS